MAKRKTNETEASVEEFIDSIEDESKRADCRSIAQLMATATGVEPKMWGAGIVGFGKLHYRYANGKPAEICKVGFAPRSRSFAFYLPAYPEHASLISRLGRHKYSGGCLHVRHLSDVDTDILALMVNRAFQTGGSGDA
ncbi:MAG: hypothetical protein AB7I04_22475 [Pseudomonadales bacterium]